MSSKNNFCFSSYILLLKSHVIDNKNSNQDIISQLFITICTGCGRNPEKYFDGKSLSSDLINRKVDIPETIRMCLLNTQPQKLIYKLRPFYDEYVSKEMFIHLCDKLLDLFLNDESILESRKQFIKENHYNGHELLTYLLIETAKINNKITEAKFNVFDESGFKVNYMYDDILRIAFNKKYNCFKKIIVIPVNTQFDFKVDDLLNDDELPHVSRNTIHGKWIARMEKNGFDFNSLNNKISNQKQTNGCIGSIITVNKDNTMFYLLPISVFDKNNNAQSSKQYIHDAIDSLITFYNKKGQGIEMYIPLLGTGMSRAKLNHTESFNMIKDLIINNNVKCVGTINIVIYEKDFDKVRISYDL